MLSVFSFLNVRNILVWTLSHPVISQRLESTLLNFFFFVLEVGSASVQKTLSKYDNAKMRGKEKEAQKCGRNVSKHRTQTKTELLYRQAEKNK